MVREMDGIYLAYFTAEFGTSLGIFLMQDGRLMGGDVGGGIYDGKLELEDGIATGTITFRTVQGGSTITGKQNDLPMSYDVPISLSLPLEGHDFHTIETLGGHVNVRFEKIRSL